MEAHEPKSSSHQTHHHHSFTKMGVGVIGLVLVAVTLFTVFMFSPLTVDQRPVIRIILALGAACIAVAIPGAINVRVHDYITASGAMGVLILVYCFNPAGVKQSVGIPQPPTASAPAPLIPPRDSRHHVSGTQSRPASVPAHHNHPHNSNR